MKLFFALLDWLLDLADRICAVVKPLEIDAPHPLDDEL